MNVSYFLMERLIFNLKFSGETLLGKHCNDRKKLLLLIHSVTYLNKWFVGCYKTDQIVNSCSSVAHIATTFPDLFDLGWLQIHARLKRCIMHNKKNCTVCKNSKTITVNNGGVRALRGGGRKTHGYRDAKKHVFERGEPVLPITIATGRPGCFNQLLVCRGGSG